MPGSRYCVPRPRVHDEDLACIRISPSYRALIRLVLGEIGCVKSDERKKQEQ